MDQEQNALHCGVVLYAFLVMSSSTDSLSNMIAISHWGYLNLHVAQLKFKPNYKYSPTVALATNHYHIQLMIIEVGSAELR